MSLTLGSLFDGSGGFPLAARMCGIEPVWASEIESYPIAVTTKNFPNMKHLGDITKINGAEIEPVDIISFGSPCQDLSTAGLRKGMKHADKGDDETTRSGLFIEAIRIIKEMRNGTSNEFPRWIIWENVFGAFSSNNGEDFWTVLKEIYGITQKEFCIPRLETWPKSGEILGDGCSLAWRTMDAQYWGVPQMRRRVFIVADFRGHSASKILFERDGLPRNFSEIQKERKETSTDIGAGSPFTIQERHGKPGGGKGILIQEDKASTLDCPNSQRVVIPIEGNGTRPSHRGSGVGKSDKMFTLNSTEQHGVIETKAVSFDPGACRYLGCAFEEVSNTLANGTAPGFHNGVAIMKTVYENHAQDSRYRGPLDAVMGMNSNMGTGGGNVPLVAEKKVFRKVSRAKDKDDVTTWEETDRTCTLNTFDLGGARASELVVENEESV